MRLVWSLLFISILISGCSSDISGSGDDQHDKTPTTTYSLTESYDSNTAVIADLYTLDVNLTSDDGSSFQAGVQPTSTTTASNIKLNFIDPQNNNRFDITYSSQCNSSLSTTDTCQITLLPNQNAVEIEN